MTDTTHRFAAGIFLLVMAVAAALPMAIAYGPAAVAAEEAGR